MKLKPGCLCRSLAGNDRDRYYIIIDDQGDYAAVADGEKNDCSQSRTEKQEAYPGRENAGFIRLFSDG